VSDRRTQAALLLTVAAMALHLGRGDAALAYVKPGLRPLLLASGVLLLLLAAAAFSLRGRDQGAAERSGERPGRQPHGPRVAWLLALPPLALVLVAPPALGAFAASRQSLQPSQLAPAEQPPAGARQALFPPLALPVDGAVPMSIGEYLLRDLEEPRSLAGARIRLLGFVTPNRSGRDGYLLTRFAISCCAADATALRVAVRGDRVPRAPDTWLEVEGWWTQRAAGEAPLFQAASVRVVAPPPEPYEGGIPAF
jgi:uncharacterized repeat protein (TIGR03943 family)